MNKLITLLFIVLTYLNTQAQNFTITATPWQSVIPCESDLGIITTSVSGGAPPYTYQWSDGSTTADLGYIFAGTYSVTVTDANFNTASASATITQYPHFWGHISYYAPTPGNCDGGIIWSPWQPREGLLYLDNPGPFTPILGSYALGLNLCVSSTPVTINLYTWLGCPWQFNGLTIDPSQYTSGPYSITHQVTQQNPCLSDVSFTIYNSDKLNSQTMPPPLNGGVSGYNGYTHIEIRDLQNNLIKEIYNMPAGPLMQHQDSNMYNVTSLIPGTYVFHYVEGIYKYDIFTTPLDTFGIHLTDTFSVTGTGTLPLATISATGSTGLCSGDSLLLTATFDPDYTYQWKRNNNNISGATSSTFYANLAGYYTVVITNICGSTTSNTITISITNLATVSISASGAPIACNGNYVLLNSFASGATSRQWQLDGVDIPGATLNNYIAYNAGNYTMVVTNSCGSITSNIITISSYNTPTASITASGSTSLCGDSVMLNANTGAGFTYQWKLNGNNITGATSSSFIATNPGNYSVLIFNPCGSSTSNIISVTTGAAPSAAIIASGSTSICAGGFVTLDANTGTGLTYQWQLNGNNISGATASSYSAGTAGNYTSVVSNACGNSTSNVISVTTGAAPSAAITASGSTSICAGSSVTLNANTGTGLSYQWQLNGNNISGATASSYSANSAGNYTAVVSNACGSSTSNIISVTIGAAPSAAITASGSTSICAGSSVTLNANTGTGLTYQWQLNGNNISGATASSYSAGTTGNYTAVVSNACGSSISNVISVTTGAAPSAAITASGSTSVCAGSSVTLNANTGTGLTYQWQLNGNNISGATTSSYSATTSGNYSVFVTNSCGNSVSNIISISVISAPGSAGSISGPTSFCRHSTQSFSVSPVAGATNYTWTVPPQATIISGLGTNSVVISFIVKQGDITVKASNSCGSGPLSVLPVQLLKCANPNSNNPNNPLRTAFNTVIYPNPSLDDFNCEIHGESDQIFSLRVFDYSGRIVELKENIVSNKNFTFGNDLAPGFYFVEIKSGEDKEIYNVVKVK